MNTQKEKQPTWLKAMQNGTIGEARAKAFLMDRFWILERSVDIDGADLIIQRKITDRTLFDKMPPNLGVVQVKFFESTSTTQYIPEKYILDEEGNSRESFFLLCNTGYEEDAKMFFLTSDMIVEKFSSMEKNGVKKYKLPGSIVIDTDMYLIKSRTDILDIIEEKLQAADFIKNRIFISWQLPNISIDSSAILSDYKEPIKNTWGDIPFEFKNIKEETFKASQDVYMLYDNLRNIAEHTDPIESVYIIDNLEDNLSILSNKIKDLLCNNEFYDACVHHKNIVEALKEDGLINNYIKAQEYLKDRISKFLYNSLPIDPNIVLLIKIEFSLDDFVVYNIEFSFENVCAYFNIPDKRNIKNNFIEIPTDCSYHGINKITDCSFEYYILAGRYDFSDKEEYNSNNYNSSSFFLYVECMNKLYELKYCN